jgi:hypothetical protein
LEKTEKETLELTTKTLLMKIEKKNNIKDSSLQVITLRETEIGRERERESDTETGQRKRRRNGKNKERKRERNGKNKERNREREGGREREA